MWIYMGGGEALAAYRRRRRVREFDECVRACGATARRCLDALASGRGDRPRSHLLAALTAARDCLTVCSLTAALVARESDRARLALAPCAEACRRCAEACEALSPDERAADCARRCRDCEATCGELAGRDRA